MARDRIWLLSADGTLGYINSVTGQVNPTVVGNARTLFGLTDPYDEPTSICTDGRELFFSVGVRANMPYHVFAVDLASSPLTGRPIAQLSLAPNMTVPRRGATLCMGRDGKLIALDDVLVTIDPVTGAQQTISPSYWQGSQPYAVYPDKAVPFAYNPWNDTAIAIPFAPGDRVFHWSGTAWSMALNGWLWDLGPCHTTSPAPFVLFGKGCRNASNKEPRMGWQGVPRQGQTFAVTLRDAEPSSLAVIWFGWSDTSWASLGALPYSGTSFGAPGCSLLVSPDAPLPFWTDGSGNAAYPVALPVNPAIAGFEIFAQSISSAGAGVNALGFVSSDAVAVRVR